MYRIISLGSLYKIVFYIGPQTYWIISNVDIIFDKIQDLRPNPTTQPPIKLSIPKPFFSPTSAPTPIDQPSDHHY